MNLNKISVIILDLRSGEQFFGYLIIIKKITKVIILDAITTKSKVLSVEYSLNLDCSASLR